MKEFHATTGEERQNPRQVGMCEIEDIKYRLIHRCSWCISEGVSRPASRLILAKKQLDQDEERRTGF
jgi:hypothetical protein